jgi:hypothetical protein
VHEGGGEQRAGRQAQQVLRIDAAVVAHAHAHQQGRDPHASDAGDQRGREDDQQVHKRFFQCPNKNRPEGRLFVVREAGAAPPSG